jgi:hypothetical protein
MGGALSDLLLFSWLAAFVIGIVITEPYSFELCVACSHCGGITSG